ncbi:hypothetical protein ACVCAH_05710 [Micromonospora sp. LZ34]
MAGVGEVRGAGTGAGGSATGEPVRSDGVRAGRAPGGGVPTAGRGPGTGDPVDVGAGLPAVVGVPVGVTTGEGVGLSGDGVASSGDVGEVGDRVALGLTDADGEGEGDGPVLGELDGDGRGGGAVVPPDGRDRVGAGVRVGTGSAGNPAGPDGRRAAGRHGVVAAGPTDGEAGGVTAGWLVTGSGITTGPTDGVGMNGVLVSGNAVLPTVADPVLIAARIGIDAVPASRATVNR